MTNDTDCRKQALLNKIPKPKLPKLIIDPLNKVKVETKMLLKQERVVNKFWTKNDRKYAGCFLTMVRNYKG